MQVKMQQLEQLEKRLKDDVCGTTSTLASCTSFTLARTMTWYMEQQTGSKSGKEYIKAVYCHFVI